MENKIIDLHKVAGLFREIQEEDFNKTEAKEISEFKKTVEAIETPVEETTEEVVEELTAAQKKLPKGLKDAIAKKQGDSTDDDDEVEEAKEEEVEESTTLSDILNAAGVQQVTDADINQPETEAQPVVEEEPVVEEPVVEEEPVTEEPEMVAMDTNTLAQILSLAGLKPVTDADLNQPEADAEPVEEYSNSPDEEYADTDTQLNKMSGGINRPKAMPTVGNDGHNRLVMKLKKAYSDIE